MFNQNTSINIRVVLRMIVTIILMNMMIIMMKDIVIMMINVKVLGKIIDQIIILLA